MYAKLRRGGSRERHTTPADPQWPESSSCPATYFPAAERAPYPETAAHAQGAPAPRTAPLQRLLQRRLPFPSRNHVAPLSCSSISLLAAGFASEPPGETAAFTL